jgi:hypothetical protein
MCLHDDILCILSPHKKMSGQMACIAAMKQCKTTVMAPHMIVALRELVERGYVREFSEENQRNGRRAHTRILFTPPLYRHYGLSPIGITRQRMLLSARRQEEVHAERRRNA